MKPSNDDNILEVVAVLGASQMVSRSFIFDLGHWASNN